MDNLVMKNSKSHLIFNKLKMNLCLHKMMKTLLIRIPIMKGVILMKIYQIMKTMALIATALTRILINKKMTFLIQTLMILNQKLKIQLQIFPKQALIATVLTRIPIGKAET